MIVYRFLPTINDFFFRISNRIGSTVRLVLIFICCLLLSALSFFDLGAKEDTMIKMISGSLLMLVMSILYAKERSQRVICNKKICIPLDLFAIGIIIVSLIHPMEPGYVVFAIDLIIVFPVFYYCVINSNSVNSLYRLSAISIVMEGVIVFFLCLLLATTGELGLFDGRVMGHTTHPNLLGGLGLIMVTSGAYLLISRRDNILRLISSFAVGGGISFVIISSSRAAMLAIAGCAIAAVIFMIKRKDVIRGGKIISVRLFVILGVMVMSLVVGTLMDDINAKSLENKTENTAQTQVEGNSEEEIGSLKNRIAPGKDLNSYSSGRIEIWKVYIQNFSFPGKDPEEIKHNFPPGSAWRAHNNIIDYYYRCGYIVGSFYLIFFIVLCGMGAKMLFRKEYNSPDSFFLVEATGCYVVYALLEIATLPFIRGVMLLFFVLCGPLFMGKNRQKRSGSVSDTP